MKSPKRYSSCKLLHQLPRKFCERKLTLERGVLVTLNILHHVKAVERTDKKAQSACGSAPIRRRLKQIYKAKKIASMALGRHCRFEGCKELAPSICRKCRGPYCQKHIAEHTMNCRFK